ncbi:MAG: PEP/pyruvate-binding domain-containing protein [Candidatus Saccharibacteria bacterium]
MSKIKISDAGKAGSLLILKQAGFSVPPFFVCDSTWTEADINHEIAAVLPDSKYFAVRSSAANEDSLDKSFAGHYYSSVGTPRKDIYKEFNTVIDSYDGLAGSVIIQDFIASDIAGVMFSQAGDNHIVINATQGLCLPVVGGDPCDEYILDRSGKIIDRTIVIKASKFFIRGQIMSLATSGESLSDAQLKTLAGLAIEIQRLFGSAQDIEWCFYNGELFVLQSRPITQSIDISELVYYDSANIAESYSGIVLPLTCSFAGSVYDQVYRDMLRRSGVSAQAIKRQAAVFAGLLGFFEGRMYYNMNNWYKMAAFLPGYNRNKSNFELMITSNVIEDITTGISPSVSSKLFYPLILLIKVGLFGHSSRHFERTVISSLAELRAHNFDDMGYTEAIDLYRELNDNLLRRWYVAIENDFLVMTYLGFLNKLIDQKTLQGLITFRSKATEQTLALAQISQASKVIEPVWKSIQLGDVVAFNRQIARRSDIQSLLDTYLAKFGGRFANELKLESVGIDEDMNKLLAVLKIYGDYQPTNKDSHHSPRLPSKNRLLSSILLKKFKKYASRREEFRLLRSNSFAVVRRLFRKMGELLVQSGVLEKLDDVFYLELTEILNPATINDKSLTETVRRRKKEYSSYKKIEPPVHFATSNDSLPRVVGAKSNVLVQARAASPGIIRGKVKLFKEFSMPDAIDFDILVTSHTDPGWTSLIALSKGLIIEHGGVLSHASIVARELSIPAVIGATNALNCLKDGQMVEINGSTGSIKIL